MTNNQQNNDANDIGKCLIDAAQLMARIKYLTYIVENFGRSVRELNAELESEAMKEPNA